MKVFLSWSGERSRQMAVALRDWLPLLLHFCEPWLSQRDIAAGERWAVEIGKELEGSNFGVIIITRDNLTAPWILFEAGALSKAFTASAVCPYLVDIDFKELTGPLAQFQAKKADRASTMDLIDSINSRSKQPIEETRLRELFDVLWPKLEARIRDLPPPETHTPLPARPQTDVIEELVENTRRMETRLDFLSGLVERLADASVPAASPRRLAFPVEVRLRRPFSGKEIGTIMEFPDTADDIAESIALAVGLPLSTLDRDWYLTDRDTNKNLNARQLRAAFAKTRATNKRLLLDADDIPF